MQADFHYYATYCAASLAGYTQQECCEISYCAQLVDLCSKTLLVALKAPRDAATTQLQAELMDARTDILGIQDITRIWASFHFLPRDLHANPGKGGVRYRHKYQLICGTNGELLVDTVELARGRGTQAVGLAMHVLADTWAHKNFAGTPSLVINNTSGQFYELLGEDGTEGERIIHFRHNPSAPDDLENGLYINSVYQQSEYSIMNLGHGRAGHLPDYSFARYRYLPAWGDYSEVLKDNPTDYWHAFRQMVYAMRCLRTGESFETDCYDDDAVRGWETDIHKILVKRQHNASDDWRELGKRITGVELEPFDLSKYQREYFNAPEQDKDETFLGKFFVAALAQKSMVTNRIFHTGSLLAGVSLDYREKGFGGIRDYLHLVRRMSKEEAHE